MNTDNFTAQMVGVFLAETLKNVAKGSANALYNNFNSPLYSEITTLGLNDSMDAEEIAKQLEAQPSILESVQQKLSDNPTLAEEISKTFREYRLISATTYIEKIEIKDASLLISRKNLDLLVEKADNTIQKRADEIIDCLLHKLKEINPSLINSIQEPSMRHALRSAQKGYALSGDRDLRDLLVDILVERAEQNERNLVQIILGESLEIVPKLTFQQLDVLSILFLIKNVNKDELINLESLINFLKINLINSLTDMRRRTGSR